MPSARFKGVVAAMCLLTIATFVAEPYLVSHAPAPRAAAPDFTLATIDGSVVKLSDRPPGSLALVEFMATWCFPCRQQIKDLSEVRSTFDKGEVAIISVDEEYSVAGERVAEFRSAFASISGSVEGAGWYFAVDTVEAHVGLQYGATGLPTVVLVDAEGHIAHTWFGSVSSTTLRSAISAELSG